MKQLTQIIIALTFFFIVGISFIFDSPPDLSGRSRAIEVLAGASSQEIAVGLKQNGVVRSKWGFLLLAKALRMDLRFQAGHYLFPSRTSLLKVILMLARGEVAFDGLRVTFPEGTSIYKMGLILKEAGYKDWAGFQALKLRALPLELKEKYPFLSSIPINSLEGYLYPDTYFIDPVSSPQNIAGTMLARFQDQIYVFWQKNRGNRSLTLHQLLTLASIVEKEARVSAEQPIIASVFYNRLKIGMPLAADPTVKYALEQPTKKVYYNQLEVKSPYNTYKRYGLPPGPICNPDLEAFKAVLFPAQTDYLFFVAKPDGLHVFSKTWEEHQKAKQVIKNNL